MKIISDQGPKSERCGTLETIALLIASLLPVPAVWLGMHALKNVYWTFFLYHGCCVLPVCFWKRSLWSTTIGSLPTPRQTIMLALVAVGVCTLAIMLYESVGQHLLTDAAILKLLTRIGYKQGVWLPMSLYLIFANAFFEEFFWRGTILNFFERRFPDKPKFGIVWSSTTYALFHYIIFRQVLKPLWAEIGCLLLVLYGASLAVVYKRTQSLIYTALCHGLVTDLTAMVLMLLLLIRCGENPL